MQAYDFYYLFKNYGCNMEFGGDDQWSNMLAGTELIRKKLGKDAYCMTINLLLNSEGKKMGKTVNGAVWLDENKTSPFEFYQYWRNCKDDEVIRFLKMLTFIPLDQIEAMAIWQGEELNEAKDILAYELTSLVHGEDNANKAKEASMALFSGGSDDSNMPTATLSEGDLADGKINIIDLLIKCDLSSSKSEARRLIEQGGIAIDDNKISDISFSLTKDDLQEGVTLRKGKKTFKKAIIV